MESEKSVGTILKEARLAKGLSIADAEQATSVRARYLEAVENDEYEKTPGEVFLKGIIRNYGNYLGLDGLELVKLYKANHQGVAAENINSAGIREVEKVRLNIQLKEKRDIGSGTGRFEMPQLPMKQIAAGLAVVVLLGIGYVAVPKVIEYFKNMPQAEQKQEEVQVNASTAVKPPSVLDKVQVEMEAKDSCWTEVTADGKEVFVGMLNAKDKRTFEAKDKIVVKYGNIGAMKLAKDSCWTEVTADGKEVFVGMLNAKDKRTFEAKDKIVVKYGNIGAMKLVVNGQPVDLKGEHGVAVKTYLRANATAEAPQTAEKAVSEAPVEQEAAPVKQEAVQEAPQVVVEPKQEVVKPAAKAAVPAEKKQKAKVKQEEKK